MRKGRAERMGESNLQNDSRSFKKRFFFVGFILLDSLGFDKKTSQHGWLSHWVGIAHALHDPFDLPQIQLSNLVKLAASIHHKRKNVCRRNVPRWKDPYEAVSKVPRCASCQCLKATDLVDSN